MKRRNKIQVDAVDVEIRDNEIEVVTTTAKINNNGKGSQLNGVTNGKVATAKSDDETIVNEYVENCRNYDVQIDPSVVIALKTGLVTNYIMNTYSKISLSEKFL